MKATARIALVVFFWIASSGAQSNSAGLLSIIQNQRGIRTAAVFARHAGKTTDIESSQSYTYTVPLFSLPGRDGLDLNLNLHYSSLVWPGNPGLGVLGFNLDLDWPSPGFNLGFGHLLWSSDLSSGTLIDPDGTAHHLVPIAGGNNTLYQSTDATYIQVQHPAGGNDTVTFKNGRRMFYQPTAQTNAQMSTFSRPIQIEDTNGNFITINYANSFDASISSIVDTVGRTITFFYDLGNGKIGSQGTGWLVCITDGSACNAPGSRTFNFAWNHNFTLNYNFQSIAYGVAPAGPGNSTLTGITRPDGTYVQCNYGDWWLVNDIKEFSKTGNLRYEVSYNFPPVGATPLKNGPTYTTKTIFDGTNTGTWTYAVAINPNNQVTSFVVADPLGTTTTTTFSANGDWQDGLPIQEQVSAQGKIWETIKTAWTSDNGSSGVNPRKTSITRILDDNATQSQVVIGYDSFFNVNDRKEYDFGANAPGALLRETVTSYASNLGNIVDRPSDVQIKDGSGNLISHTTYAYDGSPVQSVTPAAPQHDDNYSAFSSNPRGNLTSATSYTNAAQGSGAIVSNLTYDVLGNRVAAQMGCCTHVQAVYSATTQYAYPDSIVNGPQGSQLTTSYTYNMSVGKVASITGPNNDTTTFTYDIDARPVSTHTPDQQTVSDGYDDSSAYPEVTTSTTANSLVTTLTTDFLGRALRNQTFNGSALVASRSFTNDVLGRMLEASNPFAPGETPVFTTYSYDALGRVVLTTPPAIISPPSDPSNPPPPPTGPAQNSYQTIYAGAAVTFVDPANKQHKQYTDALGRLVRVYEPGGGGPGSSSAGSLTINGSLQSGIVGGHSATPGTGAVSFNGNLQSKQVQIQAATPATGSFTVTGNERQYTYSYPCGLFLRQTCRRTDWDSGSVYVTINGYTVGASYGQGSTVKTIATTLATQLNAAASPVTVPTMPTSGVVSFVTKATGAAADYSVTFNSSGNNRPPGEFSGSSFWNPVPPPQTLTGGQDAQYNTVYDAGNCIVTLNGIAYGSSWSGSGTTAAAIAAALAISITSDTSGFVNASAAGNTITLLARSPGSNSNVPFSSSCSYDTGNFGGPSFTTTDSGTTLTGGSDAVPGTQVTDYGTVTLNIGSSGSATACYGNNPSTSCNGNNNTTAAQVASDLASRLAALNPPFAISASGANLSIGWKTVGAAGNVGVTVTSSTGQPNYFSGPSFSAAGTTLSGGSDPTAPSLNTPYITTYSYDPLGDLLQVVQGPQTRNYIYDSLGRMTSSCIPEAANQCASYTYTDFGAPQVKIDQRGITTNYSYDALNHLAAIQYSDGTPTVSYTYGTQGAANFSAGRLLAMTDGTGSENYQYDVMGRTVQISKTIGSNTYVTGYSYNSAGELAAMQYPSGRIVSESYDGIGRLSQVSANGANIFNANGYNAAGQLLSATYGNGVLGNFSYNNQLQIAGIMYGGSAGNILSLGYNWGTATDDGLLQGVTDNLNPARSTAYTYDELSRLSTAGTVDLSSPASWAQSYVYDRFGNKLSQNPMGGIGYMPTIEFTVDPATNHITSPGFSYDADGDMTSDGVHTYTFDGANRIIHVDGAANTYAYDGKNLRVNRNSDHFIYSGGQVIAEYASSAPASSPSIEHIYARGRRVATIAGGGTIYHFWDHLSIRASADSSGNVVRTFGHFPFGETWYETGNPSAWKFTTYYRDAESGLDYANDRFDSSRLGRFMSLDPVPGRLANPQSLNRYAYVGNNPIRYADPTGMDPEDDPLDAPGDGGGGDGGGGGGGDFGGGPSGPGDFAPGDGGDLGNLGGDSGPSSPGDSSAPGDGSSPGNDASGNAAPGDTSPGDGSSVSNDGGTDAPGDVTPGDGGSVGNDSGTSAPGDVAPGGSVGNDSGTSAPGDTAPGGSVVDNGTSAPGDSPPGGKSGGSDGTTPGDSSSDPDGGTVAPPPTVDPARGEPWGRRPRVTRGGHFAPPSAITPPSNPTIYVNPDGTYEIRVPAAVAGSIG